MRITYESGIVLKHSMYIDSFTNIILEAETVRVKETFHLMIAVGPFLLGPQ